MSLTKYFSANVAQGQCVGGSTIINYGICFPIPDNLFQYWRQTFGITIDKKRLNSAYEKVKEMMGIKTIDPLDAGISHRKLKCGCDMLNYSGNWMDKSYGDDGKHSAYSAYLRNANFDNITLYTNCTADKITTNGNKVTSVTGIIKNECNDINKITVNAKQIIISAGSIASSEILLKNNLSNRNKQVGKHVSIHPAAPIVAIFDENLRQDFEFPMAYYCDEFSILKTGKPGFLIESLCIPLSNYSILMPSFGDENETYVKGYPYSAMAGVLVHDEPNGTVELNWNKDAILDYNLTKIDQRKMIDGMKETARIFLTAGAKKIITGHMEKTEICNMKDIQMIETKGVGLGSLLMASAHPQGGNRMGEDKSLSVVNSNCQSHEFSNLYVCDASVFPTCLFLLERLFFNKISEDAIEPAEIIICFAFTVILFMSLHSFLMIPVTDVTLFPLVVILSAVQFVYNVILSKFAFLK